MQSSRRRFLFGTSSALALLPAQLSASSLRSSFDTSIWDVLVSTIAGPVELSPVLRAALTRDFEAKFGARAIADMAQYFTKNGIARVLDPQPEPYENQIQWIALYLYTGSADPSDDQARLINYPYSLGWKSLPFAKAPGLCSGPEFGYWLQPWSAA